MSEHRKSTLIRAVLAFENRMLSEAELAHELSTANDFDLSVLVWLRFIRRTLPQGVFDDVRTARGISDADIDEACMRVADERPLDRTWRGLLGAKTPRRRSVRASQ